MIKSVIFTLIASYTLLLTCGCSSIMTHSGGNQSYYSGTSANIALLKDDNTSWVLRPFVAIDLPFSATVDTLLLPYDYLRSGKDKTLGSPRERVIQAEASNIEFTTGSSIPPRQI